jgi:60 kDa SS-A/Ro ribonucleoprotein
MLTALELTATQWAQIATTQAAERADILNVGGFSDAVFTMVSRFADGKAGADHWVGEIDKISLASQQKER